jgi:hypothetical protein
MRVGRWLKPQTLSSDIWLWWGWVYFFQHLLEACHKIQHFGIASPNISKRLPSTSHAFDMGSKELVRNPGPTEQCSACLALSMVLC